MCPWSLLVLVFFHLLCVKILVSYLYSFVKFVQSLFYKRFVLELFVIFPALLVHVKGGLGVIDLFSRFVAILACKFVCFN